MFTPIRFYGFTVYMYLNIISHKEGVVKELKVNALTI